MIILISRGVPVLSREKCHGLSRDKGGYDDKLNDNKNPSSV